jgi:hypothetical protein
MYVVAAALNTGQQANTKWPERDNVMLPLNFVLGMQKRNSTVHARWLKGGSSPIVSPSGAHIGRIAQSVLPLRTLPQSADRDLVQVRLDATGIKSPLCCCSLRCLCVGGVAKRREPIEGGPAKKGVGTGGRVGDFRPPTVIAVHEIVQPHFVQEDNWFFLLHATCQ